VEQAWLDDPYGITARGFLAFFKKLYDIADNGHPMMPSAQAIVVAALADLNIDPELEEALRARGDRKGARLSAEARCRLGEALKAKRRRPQF
jgi:plasmid stability protein